MTAVVPNKLANIQSLRGIAALLVVFTHLPAMEAKHGGEQILPHFFRFGISGVDLFFVISGFIMVYVTWGQTESIKNSLKFLFARLTRIYPIYWLIALLVLGAWVFRPSLISFDPAQTSLVKSFLLWPDQTLPMLKVAWTLVHELYFYLIFALVLLLPMRWRLTALSVWIGLVILGNQLGWGQFSPETALITHPLSVEFFLGAVTGWVFKRFGAYGGWPVFLVGCLLWGVGIYLLSTRFAPDGFPTDWERVLYFGLPGVLILYGVASIEAHGFRFPRWSSIFGDWSYSLYLSHILSLSVVGVLWRAFARPGVVDNIIAIILMLVGSILVSAIFWYVFEKPALSFFKKLRFKLFPERALSRQSEK